MTATATHSHGQVLHILLQLFTLILIVMPSWKHATASSKKLSKSTESYFGKLQWLHFCWQIRQFCSWMLHNLQHSAQDTVIKTEQSYLLLLSRNAGTHVSMLAVLCQHGIMTQDFLNIKYNSFRQNYLHKFANVSGTIIVMWHRNMPHGQLLCTENITQRRHFFQRWTFGMSLKFIHIICSFKYRHFTII